MESTREEILGLDLFVLPEQSQGKQRYLSHNRQFSGDIKI